MDKRCFLWLAVVALVTSVNLGASPIRAQTNMTVTIGFIPTSQANGPQILYMKQHNLLQKYASEFGYEVQSKYLVFQTGPQITEGMVKGDIDFGIAGYLPLATILASNLPILPLSNIEGSGHWLLVRPNSPIKDLQDLVDRRAKIATAVGSTSQYVLLEMFRIYFGKSPEELGVTVVNMPPSEGITFPRGIDAIIYWEAPASLAENKVGAVRLIDEYGRTGPAHKLGAGMNLFKEQPEIWGKSLYAPESLVAYRVFSTVRKELTVTHPKLVVAFLLAQQEAVKILSRDFKQAYDLNKEYWPLPFDTVSSFFRLNSVPGRRDWIWLTEGDFKPVVWGSQWAYTNGLMRRPVTWDIVKDYLGPIASISKEAYQRSGSYPALVEIAREAKLGDQPAPDLRGSPVWMLDQWRGPMPQAARVAK